MEQVKCPHCGWIRSVDVQAIEDGGMTSVTAGADGVTKAVEAIKNYMGNSALPMMRTPGSICPPAQTAIIPTCTM